jgi:hypothetical protein
VRRNTYEERGEDVLRFASPSPAELLLSNHDNLAFGRVRETENIVQLLSTAGGV